jgi:hypothetical protein
MRRVIEKLRQKPKEVRVQVSFLSALGITGVIGVLWGVTLPLRLQGLPQGDQTAQVESANGLNSFFQSTKNNLGQIIGGISTTTSTDTQNQVIDNAPKSDAYTAGAPADAVPNNDYQLEAQQPVVTPVNRQEVRIGTTTSTTKPQE